MYIIMYTFDVKLMLSLLIYLIELRTGKLWNQDS